MDPDTRNVLTAELWRSVAWAGLALVGWAFLIGESPRLDATLLNTLGLPFLTWAFLTVGSIGLRLWTERGLTLRSRAGLSVALTLGMIVSGFGVVYAVTVLGRSLLVVGTLYLTTTLGTILWVAVFRPGRAEVTV